MDTQMDHPTVTAARRNRARWSVLAATGFAMAASAPAIILLAGLVFGLDLTAALFFVIPIVVLSAVAYAVLRFGTWAKVTGIVAGVLGGGMFFWLAFGLFLPASFFDFVGGLLFTPGILIGIGASIAALRAGRAGRSNSRLEAKEAKVLKATAAVVAALVLMSGTLTVLGRTSADPSTAAATVTMKSFEFEPATLTVAGGDTLFIDNNDPFFHTFTIDALDIDEGLSVGSSTAVEIPDQPGTYTFYCVPHSSDADDPDLDEDMAGTVIVT